MIDTNHTPAVELVGVSKRFGRQLAVDDLSLCVPAGQVFGLIGANGAGKSTTIKMLMGTLAPDLGRIRVLGMDVLATPTRVKKRVGYVPELHHMYRWMRVAEVIRFARSFYDTWNDSLCESMLDLFQLERAKKIKQLSKGMAAKLALLLAVSHEPELLILDEPMSGMDPIVREEFLDGVLTTICEGRQTVIFSSHALDDVQRLADSIGILSHGRLLIHRGIDELLASTKRLRAVLKDGCLPTAAPAGTIWQRVDRREWLLTVAGYADPVVAELAANNNVASVDVIEIGLEELFKDYVRGQEEAP